MQKKYTLKEKLDYYNYKKYDLKMKLDRVNTRLEQIKLELESVGDHLEQDWDSNLARELENKKNPGI